MKTRLPATFATYAICYVIAALQYAAQGEEKRPPVYPFDVTVAGQKAVVTEANPEHALFAKVTDPVPADATVEVDSKGGMIIINVFPVMESGEVPADAQQATKVIMGAQGEKSVALNATMDGERLSPGLYGMNIVVDGNTARVMFQVQ